VKIRRNSRPPQHAHPHPDPGRAHAILPAHKKSDEATLVLSPAKWQAEFVLIANAKGRKTFRCHDRIQSTLAPAILPTCLLTLDTLFPTPPYTMDWFGGRLAPYPQDSSPYARQPTPRRLRLARIPRLGGYLLDHSVRHGPYSGKSRNMRSPTDF